MKRTFKIIVEETTDQNDVDLYYFNNMISWDGLRGGVVTAMSDIEGRYDSVDLLNKICKVLKENNFDIEEKINEENI